jgi:hypothetical protein
MEANTGHRKVESHERFPLFHFPPRRYDYQVRSATQTAELVQNIGQVNDEDASSAVRLRIRAAGSVER